MIPNELVGIDNDFYEIIFMINFHCGWTLNSGISINIANSTEANIPPWGEDNIYINIPI